MFRSVSEIPCNFKRSHVILEGFTQCRRIPCSCGRLCRKVVSKGCVGRCVGRLCRKILRSVGRLCRKIPRSVGMNESLLGNELGTLCGLF